MRVLVSVNQFMRKAMKAKNDTLRLALSILALIAIVGMAYGTYGIFFKQEVTDPFTIELNDAAGLADRDITKIVNNYMPPGAKLSEVINFLEERGFQVYKTKPEDWNEKEFKEGEGRYYAHKEETKNIIILVKTVVILISDGGEVLSASGKIHLTGF